MKFNFRSKGVLLGAVIGVLIIIAIAVLSLQNASEEWRAVRDRVLPQFMPTTYKTTIGAVNRPFFGDVDIGLVVDSDGKYEFVDAATFATWEVTEDAAYDQALRNLDARSSNLDVEVAVSGKNDPTAKYVILEIEDGYAAVRLLSSAVRRAIARELGDEYIAAIPTRDFLIFWHKDFPLFDAFANQVMAEYNSDQDYPLTPTIFYVDRSGIREMERTQP